MGNEMGNGNSGGLQVSEENVVGDTTNVAESLASIGQRSVAENTTDSIQAFEQHDMKDVPKHGPSKGLIVSNDAKGVDPLIVKNDATGVEGASQVSASKEPENLPENQSSHSTQSATEDNLLQKQTSERRDSVEEVIQVSASVESEDSHEKQQSSHDNHSARYGNLVQEQTSQRSDNVQGLNQTSASVKSEDLSQQALSREHDSETDDNLVQKQTSGRRDDVEGASQGSAPLGYEDLPEQLAHNDHPETDDNLIQKQTSHKTHGCESEPEGSASVGPADLPDRQSSHDGHSAEDSNLVEKQTSEKGEVEAEMTTSDPKTEHTKTALYNCSEEGTRDQQISKIEESLVSEGEGGEFEGIKVEKPNDSVIPHPSSSSENYVQAFPMEENKLPEEKVLTNRGVVGETKERAEQQVCGSNIFVSEHIVSCHTLNSTYLKAIDSEIEKLIIEDDEKAIEKACNAGKNIILETVRAEDVEAETFEIKLETFEYSEKEKQKGESEFISKDSYFEHAIDTAERKRNETESRYRKKEDYDSCLVSEMCKEDSKGEFEGLVGNSTSLAGQFGADRTYEEIKEYENEELDDKKEGSDDGEALPMLSTSSTEHVESVTTRMQVELEDLNAMETTATEKTELNSGKLDDQFQGVPRATISDAQISQEGSEQIQTTASPQPEPCELNKNLIQQHHLSLEFFKESVQKDMEPETETLRDKEEQIANLDQDICSLTNVTDSLEPRLPQVTENNSPLLFELQSKQNLEDESHETRDRLLVDSGKQPQNEEENSIPMDCTYSITTLETLEGSGRFNAKPNQENLHLGSDRSSMASSNLEQLSVATEDSAPQEEKNGYEESSILYPTESMKHLIYKSESGGRAQEHAASNIILEVGIEMSKQNPSVVVETSLSTVESSRQDSDMSPLLNQNKSRENEVSAKPLKEESYAEESPEPQKGMILKRSIEDVWKSPSNKIMEEPLRGKSKQKPRTSLFSSCMCCTTAIN